MKPTLHGKQIHQMTSHSRLLRDASGPPLPLSGSRSNRLDAIIVPATRPASSLVGLVEMLVVLCSRQTKVEQVAKRVSETRNARALIIDVPMTCQLPNLPMRTAADEFQKASALRSSDLSLKRNLGLLLAKLTGWNKIVFVDDDITLSRSETFTRLAHQLNNSQIAGMVCRKFPDNSVVCQARRLAKLRQDNFVSGSVLGVHCSDFPLPFFPDIYNEDWFFSANRSPSTSCQTWENRSRPTMSPLPMSSGRVTRNLATCSLRDFTR